MLVSCDAYPGQVRTFRSKQEAPFDATVEEFELIAARDQLEFLHCGVEWGLLLLTDCGNGNSGK